MDAFSEPLYSAGLSAASIDWSHYDGLDFNNDDFATSSYSQAASFTGFELSSNELQPALTTTSTSGEISEVEDYPPHDQKASPTRPILIHNHYGSDISDFGGEIEGYRLSSASSYIGLSQAQMLANGNVATIDVGSYPKGDEAFTNSGLPSTDYNENGKTLLNFPGLSAEEEDSDVFWFGNLPSNLTANNFDSETLEDSLWVQ